MTAFTNLLTLVRACDVRRSSSHLGIHRHASPYKVCVACVRLEQHTCINMISQYSVALSTQLNAYPSPPFNVYIQMIWKKTHATL